MCSIQQDPLRSTEEKLTQSEKNSQCVMHCVEDSCIPWCTVFVLHVPRLLTVLPERTLASRDCSSFHQVRTGLGYS